MAKARSASVNLDSFLDIMTCLVGVLVLIIILTGIDASQIRVLIPTPMQYGTDKRPVFIEARNNELFLVPVEDLQTRANDELRRIRTEAQGQTDKLLILLSNAQVEDEAYRVELNYALMGQIAFRPREGARGYALQDVAREGPSDWLGRIIVNLNKEEEMITFLVRDDSFQVFKLARHLAWVEKVDVSYELLDVDQPIMFGLLGTRSSPQ